MEIRIYRQILKFRLFLNDTTIKTYITVIIIIFGISLDFKNNLYNNTKVYLPIKLNIT